MENQLLLQQANGYHRGAATADASAVSGFRGPEFKLILEGDGAGMKAFLEHLAGSVGVQADVHRYGGSRNLPSGILHQPWTYQIQCMDKRGRIRQGLGPPLLTLHPGTVRHYSDRRHLAFDLLPGCPQLSP